jgi:hypothetical protein
MRHSRCGRLVMTSVDGDHRRRVNPLLISLFQTNANIFTLQNSAQFGIMNETTVPAAFASKKVCSCFVIREWTKVMWSVFTEPYPRNARALQHSYSMKFLIRLFR